MVDLTSVQQDLGAGGVSVLTADVESRAEVGPLIVRICSVRQQSLHTLVVAWTKGQKDKRTKRQMVHQTFTKLIKSDSVFTLYCIFKRI